MRKEEMEDLSFIRYMGISIFIIIFIVLMILLSGELLRQEKTLQKRIKKNTEEVTVNEEKNKKNIKHFK
jgi:hypothetical protein